MTDVENKYAVYQELSRAKAERSAIKEEIDREKERTAKGILGSLSEIRDFSMPRPLPIRRSLWNRIKSFTDNLRKILNGAGKGKHDNSGEAGGDFRKYQQDISDYLEKEGYRNKD